MPIEFINFQVLIFTAMRRIFPEPKSEFDSCLETQTKHLTTGNCHISWILWISAGTKFAKSDIIAR